MGHVGLERHRDVDPRCSHSISILRYDTEDLASYDFTFYRFTRAVLRWAAIVFLAVLFAANVHRAATQSLTIDEAFTFHLYLAKNLRAILTDYDANNHVLFTLLAKISVGLFGTSEFAIRLPSVLGGLVYFYAVFRVCWFYFADRFLFLPAIAALTLNPFVLDFLSAGRGYGLGIGLWMLGLWFLLDGKLERSGAAFGLAVAANLTLLFPCAALILVYSIRNFWTAVDRLILPAIVASFIPLVIPLANLKPDSFYAGSETLWRGVQTITTLSLRHHMTSIPDVQIVLMNWLFPVMLASVILLAWRPKPELAMLGGALVITAVLLVIARYGAHLLYPELRTGLYLVPFFTLVYLLALRDRRAWWGIPLWMLLGLYALQWNTSHYAEWKFDAGTKRIAHLLRERQPKRVFASWELEQSLNYYRLRYRMTGMEPVIRASPDAAFDAYVLLPSDYGLIAKLGLREVYRDPLSEQVLCKPF